MSPRSRALLAFSAVLVAACGWSPSHPLDRMSPVVSQASDALDAGHADEAVEKLTAYLATGSCEDGAIGTPASVTERTAAAYDLGLALFGTALPNDVRFGARVALKDEGAKKVRGARVACALRVLRAFLELDKLDAEVRRRARFLEGNLLAIDERYDEAILAYDRALLRNPALVDGGSPVDRVVAWNRALVLEWRDDAKRDAGAPDGGGPSDGGSSPDGGGSNGDASSPEAGSPDAGSPDGGRPDSGAPSGSPDAGNDAGSDAGSPPKNQADSGLPPDAGPPPPAHGGVSDDDLLDRLSRAPTLQREAIRRQGKQSRGLVDK